MRIAVTNDLHAIGGAVGPMTQRFVEALKEAGHDATLITGIASDPLPDHLHCIGWQYPQRPKSALDALRFARELKQRSGAAFRQWMDTGRCDAWMAMVIPSAHGAISVGAGHIPLLYVCNSPWALEWQAAWRSTHAGADAPAWRSWLACTPRRRMEWAVTRHARALVSLNRIQSQWFVQEHAGLADTPRFEIPASVVCDDFRPMDASERADLRTRYQIPDDHVLLLCSRRLVPRTGVDMLIEACLGLTSTKWTLIVTGDGDQRPQLEARANGHPAIRFTGIIPFAELRAMNAAADFSMLPTRELEGFGLSAAEAFASGTPVLATPCGALPRVVGNMDPRLVAGEISVAGIRAHLERALADAELRSEAFRGRCRSFAERSYDWNALKSRYVELAEAVAEDRVEALTSRAWCVRDATD